MPAADEPGDALPSSGLLSFYDRLRERVLATVQRRGGKLGSRTTEALLMVPDVFMLLVRLTLDKEVPKATRTLLGGALAYFVLPLDLLPEAVVGPTGYIDDVILGLAVLAQAFGRQLEPYTAKHWSGSRSIREVMGDALGAADSLLGANLYDRLRQVLARRGIDLDEAAQETAVNGPHTEPAPEIVRPDPAAS